MTHRPFRLGETVRVVSHGSLYTGDQHNAALGSVWRVVMIDQQFTHLGLERHGSIVHVPFRCVEHTSHQA